MLLYAGNHFSFVVDAYTRRILSRHGWCAPDASYEDLQQLLTAALSGRLDKGLLDLWQDFHAQLVKTGNNFCRSRAAHCDACPLKPLLPKGGPRNVAS
jgi:endonuclease-3 related protein